MSQSARQTLARNVRLCRLLRGLSQEQLGDRAGLDRSYVGAIERAERNPGIDTIAKLADALELGLTDLLGEPDLQTQAARWHAAPGRRGKVREPGAAYVCRAGRSRRCEARWWVNDENARRYEDRREGIRQV